MNPNIPSDKIFTSKQIRLTAINKEDLATLAQWGEDAYFTRRLDAVPAMPKAEKQWEKWLEKEVYDSHTSYTFAIRLLDQKEMIGLAMFEGILWNQRNGWLAIGIGDARNRGKGYGREAIELLMRFGFYELNLHRIQLTVFSYNHWAIKLYESLGYQREGTFREHLQRDGVWYDMYLYGLLRQEWEKISR